jgi:nitroreductase
MDFMAAVRQRRSIRRFTSQPVPEDVLEEILEAGRLAPSSGGTSSSYFGVVRDEATRNALTAVAGGQDWIATAPVVIALCSRLIPEPPDEYYVKVNVARFGAGIVDHTNQFPDRKALRVFSSTAFPLIPGEHLALAAANRGLGSCWIGNLDTARASEILGLPDDVVCLYLLPIGYPDETPASRNLRPLESCVFYDRWQTR